MEKSEDINTKDINTKRAEELTTAWFKWAGANPSRSRHIHTSLYHFLVFYNGQVNWENKFVVSMEMIKHYLGEGATSTYNNALNDLVEWGFVLVVQKGTNQYSPTVIALRIKR